MVGEQLLGIVVFVATVWVMAPEKNGMKEYEVRKIANDLSLSGTGEDPHWATALVLNDFRYPWESEAAPRTSFRALHNDRWLYCLFDVEDHDVYIFRDRNVKTEVASSCRAEIFFRIDEKLSPYYCLEMDAAGRVMDYRGHHYRKFDLDWSWPTGQLIVKAHQTAKGYTVELAVSKASLKELGLLRNGALEAGLFRGDATPKNNREQEFRWISWVKPDAPTPDFHIPSSFGRLLLHE